MRYTKWILIVALALGACSERSAPPAAAVPAKQADTPQTGAPVGQGVSAMPNPVLAAAQTPPAPNQPPAPSLKPKYPDKAAFLADLNAAKPTMQVELDGAAVAPGFGPATRYRTNKDGSVSRQ